MKQYDQFKDMLEDEIKAIAKKGDITPTELHSAYEIMSIIKNIDTVKAMDKAEKEGQYSQRGSYGSYNSYGNSNHSPINEYSGNYSGNYSQNYSGNYSQNEGQSRDGQSMNQGNSNARAGRDGDGDGRYSERRGRDAMGRFTSRDGGSYDSSYNSYGSYGRGDYSRDMGKEQMVKELERMMQEAPSEKERHALMQCITKLEG